MKTIFAIFVLLITILIGCMEATKVEPNMNIITEPVVIYTDLSNSLPEIHLINPDGTNDRILVSNGWLFSSPQKGKIAYIEKDTIGAGKKVVYSNLDGSGRKVVANGGNIYNCFLSPDALKVMYCYDKGLQDTANLVELHVVNTDGSNDLMIETFHIKDYELTIPIAEISPDSKRIVFLKRYGKNKFYSVNIDGSSKQEIVSSTDSVLIYDGLEWFDNNNIIITTYNYKSELQLVKFSYDGKISKVFLTDTNIFSPIVSFNNDKIAFLRTTWDTDNKTEICIVNNNGNNRTNYYIFNRFYFNTFFPTWSSDGRYVVVPYNSNMQNEDYANGLYLYDVNNNKAQFVVGKTHLYNGYLISEKDLNY